MRNKLTALFAVLLMILGCDMNVTGAIDHQLTIGLDNLTLELLTLVAGDGEHKTLVVRAGAETLCSIPDIDRRFPEAGGHRFVPCTSP